MGIQPKEVRALRGSRPESPPPTMNLLRIPSDLKSGARVPKPRGASSESSDEEREGM
jgi:hypothetical protein